MKGMTVEPVARASNFLSELVARLREPVVVTQLVASVGFVSSVLGLDVDTSRWPQLIAAVVAWYGAAAVVARGAVAALRNVRERLARDHDRA